VAIRIQCNSIGKFYDSQDTSVELFMSKAAFKSDFYSPSESILIIMFCIHLLVQRSAESANMVVLTALNFDRVTPFKN